MADVLLDFRGLGASGFAAEDMVRLTRLDTLRALQDSIARVGGRFPKVMASPPTIGAATASTSIATGTTWQLYDNGNPLHADKFTLLSGVWAPIGSSFPQNITLRGRVGYLGSASVVETNPVYGANVRFKAEAPAVELWVQTTTAGSGDGIRVLVNGEYIKTGVIANDGNGLYRYILLTFAGRDPTRVIELECGPSAGLVGIRMANEYKPSPAPAPVGLRALIHGDSFVWTIVDSGDDDTGLTGALAPSIRALTGVSDVIGSGVGGSGWFTPAVKDRNYFNDRVNVDVVARAPDFIIEHGGGNDAAVTPTLSAMQAKVTEWLDAVLTAKPETVVFMLSPIIASNASAAHLTIRDAKQAAAALYPKQVAFIDTLADPWVFGTGRQGATAANGNRDWVTGTDAAHPTMNGHQYLAQRIVAGVAGAIPGLIAANLS